MPSHNCSHDFFTQKRDLDAQLALVEQSPKLSGSQNDTLQGVVGLFKEDISALKATKKMRRRKALRFFKGMRKFGIELFFLCALAVPPTRVGMLNHEEVTAFTEQIKQWWVGVRRPLNLQPWAKEFDKEYHGLFEGEHQTRGITSTDMGMEQARKPP